MSRVAQTGILLLLTLGCWTTARAEDDACCSCPMDRPGVWYTPDLASPAGLCAKPFLYQSPLETTYFTADTVAFRRDWQAKQTFATLNDPTTAVLGTHNLDFVHQPGLRVLAGRRLNDSLAVEASFLGLLQWDELRSVQDSTLNSQGTLGNLFSPLTNFGSPAQLGLDYNSFVSIHTVSQFNNAELNLRHRLDTPPSGMQVSFICGVRYMNVRERFEYRARSFSPSPVGTANAVDVVTKNGLIGTQIGGLADFQIEPRCWISFEAKAVMLANDAGQQTQYTVGPLVGPGTTTSGARNQERVTFAGDLTATAVWKFTPAIVGRVGYQGIFIDGLALGSANFLLNAANMTTAPNELARGGHLAYHGPFAGVTVTW